VILRLVFAIFSRLIPQIFCIFEQDGFSIFGKIANIYRDSSSEFEEVGLQNVNPLWRD
jgi:hypothetical protein